MLMDALRQVKKIGRRIAGIDEHAFVFDKIYKTNSWAGGSGTGSTPDATFPYREFLTDFLTRNRIRSVVDVGCGDWQFSRLIDWTGMDYTGIDVSGVVLRNTRKFATPNIRFIEMNGVSGDIPSADLLLVKDVMQHWSNADIAKFLPKLSQFKYAIVTGGYHKGRNDVNLPSKVGACRPVDLASAPFNVKGEYVFEFESDELKTVFLWRRG